LQAAGVVALGELHVLKGQRPLLWGLRGLLIEPAELRVRVPVVTAVTAVMLIVAGMAAAGALVVILVMAVLVGISMDALKFLLKLAQAAAVVVGQGEAIPLAAGVWAFTAQAQTEPVERVQTVAVAVLGDKPGRTQTIEPTMPLAAEALMAAVVGAHIVVAAAVRCVM